MKPSTQIFKKILTAVVAIILISCSGDDSPQEAIIEVSNLRVISQSGISVNSTDCIDPNENYLVEITIISQDNVPLTEPVIINYTVNGISSSVTFTEVETKTIPVSFIPGENTIALVESGQSISFQLIPEPSFELVP